MVAFIGWSGERPVGRVGRWVRQEKAGPAGDSPQEPQEQGLLKGV